MYRENFGGMYCNKILKNTRPFLTRKLKTDFYGFLTNLGEDFQYFQKQFLALICLLNYKFRSTFGQNRFSGLEAS